MGFPCRLRWCDFQEFLKENWTTGNAQETSVFSHRADFDRQDYSQYVNKRRLANARQNFAGEFLLRDNGDDSDEFVYSGFASNYELPPTPTGDNSWGIMKYSISELANMEFGMKKDGFLIGNALSKTLRNIIGNLSE